MFKSLVLAIAAFGIASSASAGPAMPEDVAELLRSMDSTNVEVEWVDDQNARVEASRNGYNYTFRMMDCDGEQRCASNMLYATFDMEGVPGIYEFMKINQYNDNYPFGRAFLIGSESEQEGYVVGIDYSFITSDENAVGEAEVNMFFLILDSFIAHMQKED